MGDGAGAAGYKTVRPDATPSSAFWTVSGAASEHAATNDNSDSSYVVNNWASNNYFVLGYASVTLSAAQRAKSVRMRARHRQTAPGDYYALSLRRDSSVASGSDWAPNPGASVVTSTGPWYTTTAQGDEWTAYVSSLVTRAEVSPPGNSDAVRVHEMYVDVDIRDLIALGTPVITNTGTQQPTITWATTPNVDGDPQKKYEIFVYPQASYTAGGFSPGVPVGSGGQPWAWTSGQVTSATGTIQVGGSLTYGTTYRVYMRVAQDFNAADWWTAYANDSGFTVAVPGEGTPIPPAPTMVRTVDQDRARTTLELAERFNLLTANQSSLETDTTGWAAGSSTTIARALGTPTPAHGIAYLSLTRTGTTGTASAITPAGTSGFRVLPSTTYTALASFRTAVTARTCKIAVKFYDSAGSYLSGSDLLSAGVSDATGAWTATTVAGSSPATAFYGAVEVQVLAAVVSEVHYADKIGLHTGSSTTWTYGGYLAATNASLVVEQQEVLGTNFLPANVADSGDTLASTVGFHKRTAADLLDRYAGAALAGETSIRWGPSAAASVLDAGFLTTAPNYDVAPLAAPGQTMTASVYARAQTGTFGVALILGYHNAAGSVTSVTGGTVTVGTDWQRIPVSLAVPDGALYAYVALDNASDTTTGRLLVDKLQLEVGTAATAWVGGSGDRPEEWTALRNSPVVGSALPAEQQAWLHDYEAKAHRSIRLYRARAEVVDTISGTSTLVSAYVNAAAYQTIGEGVWWLKDLFSPSLNWSTTWLLDSLAESIAEDVETVHPLGRDYPVSVSTWVSSGSDGTLEVRTSGEADWLALERLLRRQHALLLQSSGGLNKYVRLTSRSWDRRGHRSALQRLVSLSYVEEGAP